MEFMWVLHFKHAVSISDRISGQEAMVLAYINESEIPFSRVAGIIALAKELSTDTAALQRLSMDRTTASYKTVYGLGLTLRERLTEKLKFLEKICCLNDHLKLTSNLF